MNQTIKLSVIIITKNEAAHIADCLASVCFADEIILLDSGSTDNTLALAQAGGAQIIQTPDWPGFGPQKNRALNAAHGEWILSIDADERITPELQKEILTAINSATHHVAFALPRLSNFCGYFIRHSGWYPDYIIRLFRRESGFFSHHTVHEKVIIEKGSVGKLKTALLHYSYNNDSDVLHKMNLYSSLGAEQAFSAGKRSSLTRALISGLSAFIKTYCIKRGFLDGQAGLMVAISAAESTYHKYVKLMLLSKEK